MLLVTGELLAAAASGGVAHPPGYPLLMLITHFAIHAQDPFRALSALGDAVLGARLNGALFPPGMGGADGQTAGGDSRVPNGLLADGGVGGGVQGAAHRGALVSAACGGAAVAVLFVALAL
ncbi:hypothetical protein T484DRAFT_1838782, partial [Baffinella frigidus]